MVPSAELNAEQQKLLQVFREEFVEVTPGNGRFPKSFQMGSDKASEKPIHQVTLPRNFAIARYEVPQNLWEAVMGNNPSKWKGLRNSVEYMTFAEARDFCQKATDAMREAGLIQKTQVIRLPSEAEWEYAARAGTTTLFSFGDDSKQLGQYAWYNGNAAGNDPPVGAKMPNPWGLYDIHGYLWEWCADPWHRSYENAPADAVVWKDDGDANAHVLRGGSWKDPADSLTSTYRRRGTAELRDDAVGLRCVLANEEH
jgi:formylglycine-generating enzyme required for sulfatase activity